MRSRLERCNVRTADYQEEACDLALTKEFREDEAMLVSLSVHHLDFLLPGFHTTVLVDECTLGVGVVVQKLPPSRLRSLGATHGGTSHLSPDFTYLYFSPGFCCS